jgi:hypothetical protein
MTVQGHSRTPTLSEVIRAAIEVRAQGLHVALPGKIETYNALTQKANVKPLIMRRIATIEGKELVESLPVINDVPIIFPRSNLFFISFPLAPDDHVLLVFNDANIDNFVVGVPGEEADPQDFRSHDLSDAVAYPGFWPLARALTTAHAANLALGHDSPSGAQIHIDPALVHLGAFPGADFVALSMNTESRLAALESFAAAHTHPFLGVPPSSPGVTSPAPGAPVSTGPVAATKVKAT